MPGHQGGAHIPGTQRCLVPSGRHAFHRAQQGQQGDFRQQSQHQRHRPESAHAGVFHDVQCPRPVIAATQAIGNVGQTIFMKPACQQYGKDG